MTDDRRPKPATASGELIRPDGRVEPLAPAQPDPGAGTYASERPGRDGPEAVRVAAQSDRRRRRRSVIDPLSGRLIDLEA